MLAPKGPNGVLGGRGGHERHGGSWRGKKATKGAVEKRKHVVRQVEVFAWELGAEFLRVPRLYQVLQDNPWHAEEPCAFFIRNYPSEYRVHLCKQIHRR